jgi:8-oxo-dGTP pyrophosphatase MutT (NUDIX family)
MIYSSVPENFAPHFRLASCFVEHDGKMLLLHRHDGKSQGGRWGQPAGKVESGESEVEAAARELMEETGIGADLGRFTYFTRIRVHHEGRDFTDAMFSVRFEELPEVNLNYDEHKDFGWFTPAEALGMSLVDDFDECIRMFYRMKEGLNEPFLTEEKGMLE